MVSFNICADELGNVNIFNVPEKEFDVFAEKNGLEIRELGTGTNRFKTVILHIGTVELVLYCRSDVI